MKRMLAAAAAITLSLAAGSAVAQSRIDWKFQSNVPVNTFFFTSMVKPMADNAKMMSAGRLTITGYGADEIVPVFKIHEEVAKGTIEMGWTSAGYLTNTDLANVAFSNYPGGPSPEVFMHWYYNGGGKQLWQQYRRENLKVHSMLCGIGTTEFFAVSTKPVRTKEDLKGLKYRTSGAWAELLKDVYGAAPVVMAGGELFSALERKVIDAVDWAGPGGNIGMGFHKVAKYLIVPGVHQPSSPVECIVNLDAWNKLPDSDKAILEASAQLMTFTSYLDTGNEDQKAMAEYRKAGNEIVQLDPALVADIQAETQKWLAAKSAGNAWMDKLIKHQLEYQKTWAGNSYTRAWEKQ